MSKRWPRQGNKYSSIPASRMSNLCGFLFCFCLFFPPVSSAVKVFGWSCNLSTFAAQQGGADSEGWWMSMLLEGAGGASNDSRDHSCEHLTFPLRGAAQVGRPDRTTLFRGRWDLALLPQDYDLAARQDLLAFTPSCRYMKRRYFWTVIKWPRRGFW